MLKVTLNIFLTAFFAAGLICVYVQATRRGHRTAVRYLASFTLASLPLFLGFAWLTRDRANFKFWIVVGMAFFAFGHWLSKRGANRAIRGE
jgi:uncharacterized membrane protein YhhN